MKRIKYILLFFFVSSIKVFAKVDSISYDISKIYPKVLPKKPSGIYTGRDFIYEEPIQQPNLFTRFFISIYTKLIEFLNKLFDFDLQAKTPSGREALWYALILILVLLILTGAIFFYKKFNKSLGRNDKNNLSAEEAEKNINSVDFDKLIQTAIKGKDYRLAIRFYYLKLLKLMSDQKIIEYEYQKTNYEYFYEIKDTKLKDLFKEVSFVFDYCWYGDHLAKESDFHLAENKFSEVQKLISKL